MNNNIIGSHNIFSSHYETTINELKTRIINKKPSFIIPSSLITKEIAYCGLLLNILIKKDKKSNNYKSFYHSSYWESLSESIRFARLVLKKKTHADIKVVFFRANSTYRKLLKPFNHMNGGKLIDSIFFEDLLQEYRHTKSNFHPSIFILSLARFSVNEAQSYVSEIKNSNMKNLIILDYSEVKYEQIENYKNLVTGEIILFDESFANNEVPFGAFLVENSIYKKIITIKNCMLFSSTYSGNGTAISVVNKYLSYFLFDRRADNPYLKKELNNYKDLYNSYVNPKLAKLYNILGFDFHIDEAIDNFFRISNKLIIDLVGCAGSNMRGHNQLDIVSDVIESHSRRINYWELLQEELVKLTGLPKILPAVSGALAVDFAVIFALMAKNKCNVIITFRGNFSGKTLISEHLSDSINAKSIPVFPSFHVITINPFSPKANNDFIKAVLENNVALVWFELVQGQTSQSIPKNLLEIIQIYRYKQKYIIGIDEILTANYRTGNYLLSEGDPIKADIITVSKGLSDLSFPISVLSISNEVYTNAYEFNPELVKKIEGMYINNLGSHIALNALKKIKIKYKDNHIANLINFFKNELTKLKEDSPFIEKFLIQGLFIRIVPKRTFINKFIGQSLLKIIITNICMKKIGLFIFYDRIFISPSMDMQQAKEVIAKLHLLFYRKKIKYILFEGGLYCVLNIMKYYFSRFNLKMKCS